MADVRNVGPGYGGLGTRLLSLIMDDSSVGITAHNAWAIQNGSSVLSDSVVSLTTGPNVFPTPSYAGGGSSYNACR